MPVKGPGSLVTAVPNRTGAADSPDCPGSVADLKLASMAMCPGSARVSGGGSRGMRPSSTLVMTTPATPSAWKRSNTASRSSRVRIVIPAVQVSGASDRQARTRELLRFESVGRDDGCERQHFVPVHSHQLCWS